MSLRLPLELTLRITCHIDNLLTLYVQVKTKIVIHVVTCDITFMCEWHFKKKGHVICVCSCSICKWLQLLSLTHQHSRHNHYSWRPPFQRGVLCPIHLLFQRIPVLSLIVAFINMPWICIFLKNIFKKIEYIHCEKHRVWLTFFYALSLVNGHIKPNKC